MPQSLSDLEQRREVIAQRIAELGDLRPGITPGNTKLWLLSKPISAFMFPNLKGQAWLKHAIEEMGSLENFLPQLYERELVRATPASSKI
jgi:hypothetical protein